MLLLLTSMVFLENLKDACSLQPSNSMPQYRLDGEDLLTYSTQCISQCHEHPEAAFAQKL